MSELLALPPLLPDVVSVISMVQETHDTFTLLLSPPQGRWSAAFLPGQFNMLYVFGLGEAPISMSGDSGDPRTVVHTIRAVGSVTEALWRLGPGDELGLCGPFGRPWPMDVCEGQDVIIVAGGIGLAPLRPVIYKVMRERGRYGRVTLLHGARTPLDVLYGGEMETWRAAGIDVHVSVDRGDRTWRGSIGLVTTLFSRIDLDPARTVSMLCGPEIMMQSVQRELARRGVADDRVYLSLERNMHCAVGFCGHCQFGPEFVCMDGPVFRYDSISKFLAIREA